MNAEVEWSVEMIDMSSVHYWNRPHPPSTINCFDVGFTLAIERNLNHDLSKTVV